MQNIADANADTFRKNEFAKTDISFWENYLQHQYLYRYFAGDLQFKIMFYNFK